MDKRYRVFRYWRLNIGKMINIRFNIVVFGMVAGAALFLQPSVAQDPQFSQFYATPMYSNPAFTGNTILGRIAATYRKQWLGVPGAFSSYTFSYDHNLDNINSGLGLLMVQDKAGPAALRFTNVSGLYSYHLNLTRHHMLRAGVKVGFASRGMDVFRLKFADQYIRDDQFSSVEGLTSKTVTYFDAGAGLIFYSRSYWVGISFDHLNRPNQSFVGMESRIPIKYALQGGVKYGLSINNKGEIKNSITAAINYKGQQDWDQLDIGAYLGYSSFIAGIWYRGIPVIKAYQPGYSNNDAVIFLVGYKVQDYMSAAYSFDATISKLGMGSQGAHEISFIYEFARAEHKKGERRKSSMIPCVKF